MMSNEENVSYIKWHKNETELTDLLKGHAKKDLLDLAERQAVAVRKSWNKKKMADALAEKITEQAETIYHEVLEDVLLRLPDLDTNVYRVNDLNEIEGFIPLIEKGFFFAAKEKDGVFLIIPEEVLFSVKDRLTSLKGSVEPDQPEDADRKALILNQWRDKAVAIYGGVSLEHLKTTWNRYYDEPVTVEEIERLLR